MSVAFYRCHKTVTNYLSTANILYFKNGAELHPSVVHSFPGCAVRFIIWVNWSFTITNSKPGLILSGHCLFSIHVENNKVLWVSGFTSFVPPMRSSIQQRANMCLRLS